MKPVDELCPFRIAREICEHFSKLSKCEDSVIPESSICFRTKRAMVLSYPPASYNVDVQTCRDYLVRLRSGFSGRHTDS
jgi:hypothetical protein